MRRVLTVVVVLLLAAPASATVIDFTHLTFGPTGSVTIDGVTISGDNGALISSVAGIGLGVGDNGAIDTAYTYNAGQTRPTSIGQDGRLSLHVDGLLTAFTIQPYLTVTSGAPVRPDQGFEVSWRAPYLGLGVIWSAYAQSMGTPTTIPLATLLVKDLLNLGAWTDTNPVGELGYFVAYRTQHLDEAAALQFGFSVLSVEYEPTATPEPGSLALMALGGVLLARRRHGPTPRSKRRGALTAADASLNDTVDAA